MSQIGYARVSASDQNTDIQHERLKAAGCEIVRLEKCLREEPRRSHRVADHPRLHQGR